MPYSRKGEGARQCAANPVKFRARHAANAKKHRARRYKIIEEAKSVPCMDCGATFDPVCMDFDHRPGETKIDLVPRLKTLALKTLYAEMAKCDVICSNCHRLRTKARAGWL